LAGSRLSMRAGPEVGVTVARDPVLSVTTVRFTAFETDQFGNNNAAPAAAGAFQSQANTNSDPPKTIGPMRSAITQYPMMSLIPKRAIARIGSAQKGWIMFAVCSPIAVAMAVSARSTCSFTATGTTVADAERVQLLGGEASRTDSNRGPVVCACLAQRGKISGRVRPALAEAGQLIGCDAAISASPSMRRRRIRLRACDITLRGWHTAHRDRPRLHVQQALTLSS
jgi:hypothetical protein